MPATRGIPLQGSRSTHDMTDADKHASDIEDAALTRHLPAPSAAGTYARDNGTNWVAQLGILLADLLNYARGYIIRGGAANWEAYDASGDRQVLIGDGTNIESRLLVDADIPRTAAQIGEVFFSVDGATLTAELPVTGAAGWLVEEENGVLLVVDTP